MKLGYCHRWWKVHCCPQRITKAAGTIFRVPIVLVCLLDRERNWFKSRHGVGDLREADRQSSFCQHVIYSKQRDPLIVCDTISDDRFECSDVVINPPHIRFYAGFPLVMVDGDGSPWTLGTLCVYDVQPREFPSKDRETLFMLGRLVTAELELRDRAIRRTLHQINEVRRSHAAADGFGGNGGLGTGGDSRVNHHRNPLQTPPNPARTSDSPARCPNITVAVRPRTPPPPLPHAPPPPSPPYAHHAGRSTPRRSGPRRPCTPSTSRTSRTP